MVKKRMQEENYNENSPFIVRKPYVRLWQMIIFGIAMTIAIYSSIYFGSEDLRNFTVLLFGVLIIILFYFIQNTYFDEKTATEFQCSVYSGAMRSNTMLSFILYQNTGIYYFDQRYLSEFENASRSHNFDQVMEALGVSPKQAEKVVDAVRSMRHYEFEHKAFNGDKRNSVVIGVYPISRPRGYVYLSIYKIKD